LYDGCRYFNPNLRIDTDSIEVLIEYFSERGIVNKHWNYGKPFFGFYHGGSDE
jgi:hypothetical protein